MSTDSSIAKLDSPYNHNDHKEQQKKGSYHTSDSYTHNLSNSEADWYWSHSGGHYQQLHLNSDAKAQVFLNITLQKRKHCTVNVTFIRHLLKVYFIYAGQPSIHRVSSGDYTRVRFIFSSKFLSRLLDVYKTLEYSSSDIDS